MKFALTHTVNKKVNKSLQDRLRRERISKSVEALRELILGPSIEHTKIGKEDILKLTVQYIRRQKELMKNVVEDHETAGVYKRETNVQAPLSGNNLSKLTVCSTNEHVQTKETKILHGDVRSETAKLYYDENVADKHSSIQSQNYFSRSALFRNATEDSRYNAVKRTPLRDLNFNNTRHKDKQTIWRPWNSKKKLRPERIIRELRNRQFAIRRSIELLRILRLKFDSPTFGKRLITHTS